MEPKTFYTKNNKSFVVEIDISLLPERFEVINALAKRENGDCIVMGRETSVKDEDNSYCTWLYNPACGFIYGHYRLTRAEAFKQLVERY